LAHAHEIKQPKRREAVIENEAKARLSKELVKLDDEVPLPCPLSALRVEPIDLDRLLPFLREMEFRALSTRMTQQLTGPPPRPPSLQRRRPQRTRSSPRSRPSRSRAPTQSPIPPRSSSTGSKPPSRLGLSRSGRAWSTRPVDHTRPALCGLALALAPGLAAYLPLGHRPGDLLNATTPANCRLTRRSRG
jgi:DNA polymerase-1